VATALGVSFGLATSLLLKHSSLNLYPNIETCLVALTAYICYFFSNGLEMSGIVSLLFCGITLKHYAYHTMSRRTQRATKYIFSTLAQLSENFIFVYLGLSLFTSPPTSERVTSYVKPLFITITTVAVIFTRYASVFPLSEGINFFQKHARGQRTEELPHSYQMMLFWAGLRGAVGVALAAGFKGNNAQTLRTTVLVVVVLTVVMFGGTTARMLEVLGIRTGVEDEAASSSDDEDGPANRGAWNARRNGGGRWGRYMDDESGPGFNNPTSYRSFVRGAGRIEPPYAPNSYNHQAQAPLNNNMIFSAASSESFDSDHDEVLPMAATSSGESATQSRADANAGVTAILGDDGKWFQTLDERYLLPLFSNATASRTFHARRARRIASGANASVFMSPTGTPVESEDEGDTRTEVELDGAGARNGARSQPPLPPAAQADVSRGERGLGSPMLRTYSSDGQSRSPP
jgi:sodium/hydrogen exchanger-like protein 6/7